MASAAQITFLRTITAAEGARQSAVQAAYATYSAAGFTPTAMATYVAAVESAQNTYILAVETALGTLGAIGAGGNIAPGNIGVTNLYGSVQGYEGLN